eukprot:548035-Pelagomonas_calceolata.AAC.4
MELDNMCSHARAHVPAHLRRQPELEGDCNRHLHLGFMTGDCAMAYAGGQSCLLTDGFCT